MSKCPYCHIDFYTNESFAAHHNNCAYKNNPLPEPEQKSSENTLVDHSHDMPQDQKFEYKNMKVDELRKLAEEKSIDVKGLNKGDIVIKLSETKTKEGGSVG